AYRKIRAQKFWGSRIGRNRKIDIERISWIGHRLPCGFHQKFGTQLLIHCGAFHWVLRSERTASNQESRLAFDCVDGNTAPKQMQQCEVAVVGMHTGATK